MNGEPTQVAPFATEMVLGVRQSRSTWRLTAGCVAAVELNAPQRDILPIATGTPIIGAPGIVLAPIARDQAYRLNKCNKLSHIIATVSGTFNHIWV